MRHFLSAAAAIGLVALAGLVAFGEIASRSGRDASATSLQRLLGADARTGLAVFTGGKARIDSAMTLLNADAGERLLISGVNPETTREELATLWGGDGTRFACCVDIGRHASTTVGNAAEVSDWADSHDFQRVVIITSDYHMPRAALETRRQLGAVEILPYPVASEAASAPFFQRDWRTIGAEYLKFLAALARDQVS